MLYMLLSFLTWLGSTSVGATPTPKPQAQSPQTQPDNADGESDAIYRVIIDWRVAHPGEGPKAERLVFLDTMVPYSCLGTDGKDCSAEVKKQLAARFGKLAEPETIENYLKSNVAKGQLSKTIPTDLPQAFLSQADEDELFKRKGHDGWEVFYKKFPKAGGIIAFSRVGYNSSRAQAILYSQISCGWLCGTGHYHLLKKDSGKWVLVANFMAWIS